MTALPSKIQLFLTVPPHTAPEVKSAGFSLFPFHCSRSKGNALFFPDQTTLPNGQVLVSTAISGGTLLWRMEQMIRHHGRDKVLPALERTAMDFPLPARDGSGLLLSPSQLERKLAYYDPAVHFSPALCARYFLYRNGEQQVRFVLFDDPFSFRKKLSLLRSLDLPSAVAAYPQVCGWLEEMKGWEEFSSQPE